VVAQVGSAQITLGDLRDRLQETPAAYQQYVASAEGRRQFLNLIVREKVLLLEAQKAGLQRDPHYRVAIDRFVAQSKRRIKDYKEGLLVEMALERLRMKELAVTDADVQRYYNEHLTDFNHPIEIEASHILVSSESAGQKALSLLKQGVPFETVARQMSTDPASAAQGGKLAPFQRGTLPAEFENTAFALKNGQVSGLVKSSFGYHIIKKIGERALAPKSLDQAKEAIRARLERDRFDQWVSKAEAAIGVRVDNAALSALSAAPLTSSVAANPQESMP
jgi:peptidyl-prolyl cis-trans isomerase C